MSNNPVKIWRDLRRQMRRERTPDGIERARKALEDYERTMTPKQLAQVREETTEGAS